MAHRLALISMSINNIVGSLRCELGVDPETVKFLRPDPIEAFDHVDEPVGVSSSSLDTIVKVHRDDEWPKERLLEELERRGQPPLEET